MYMHADYTMVWDLLYLYTEVLVHMYDNISACTICTFKFEKHTIRDTPSSEHTCSCKPTCTEKICYTHNNRYLESPLLHFCPYRGCLWLFVREDFAGVQGCLKIRLLRASRFDSNPDAWNSDLVFEFRQPQLFNDNRLRISSCRREGNQ